MSIDLVVSGVLGVLLVAMIGSAWRLNRRLTQMRDGQDQMKTLIDGLNAATERAQAGIAQLRAAARESEQGLAQQTSKARALADELALMTAAGDGLANRLERELSAVPAKISEAGREKTILTGRLPQPKHKTADQEIVHALRGVR